MKTQLDAKEANRQKHCQKHRTGDGKTNANQGGRQKAARPSHIQRIKNDFDYLCILDFEATCNDVSPAPKPQEIIEFPTLLLNVTTKEIENTFHYYIRPDVNPTLTSFCTELTGISQDTIDASTSMSIFDALQSHQVWLTEAGVSTEIHGEGESKPRFCYVTCGDWDLQTCLPRQLEYHNHKAPHMFHSWINIKRPFSNLYSTKAGGMTSMLKTLCLDLIGRHHSGIDDCRNIARICVRMLEDGWSPSNSDVSQYQPVPKKLTWKEKKARKKASTWIT